MIVDRVNNFEFVFIVSRKQKIHCDFIVMLKLLTTKKRAKDLNKNLRKLHNLLNNKASTVKEFTCPTFVSI